MGLDLRTLIGRLSPTARRALESAVGLCVSRTHYDVCVEHWFLRLVEDEGSDLRRILTHFDIAPERLGAQLQRALESFKTGNGSRPELAPVIQDLARDAWVLASINYGHSRIRSGVLFLASLQDLVTQRRWIDLYPALRDIRVEALELELPTILAGSPEDDECGALGAPAERAVSTDPESARRATSTPALDQYTIDLTEEARQDKLDPVLGRDPEIRKIIDILTRKRQNNPILTGEAGVGKTAVVEGLAQRIVRGEVPERLQNIVLRRLDLGLLQAGAGVKGEFENRLKQVIEEVRGAPAPVVLFIDEAHTMIGAGGAAGQQDAANLLKPALARGELRTIAATTWAEYKRYFEKDPALSRRFQVVKVDEPDEHAAIQMMRGVARHLGHHHHVVLLEEAITASVRLSARYIPARQLPDKSMSVLDTACARVAMGQTAVPGAIEDLKHRDASLERELEALERETVLGSDHAERLAALTEQRSGVLARLAELEARWRCELELVDEIVTLRDALLASSEPADVDPIDQSDVSDVTSEDLDPREPASDGAGPDASAGELLRLEYASKREALQKLQSDSPLVSLEVDAQTIAEVISDWTGIPVGRMVADEIRSVLQLADQLRERVIGQDDALEAIARRIHTARAGLDHPGRPQGVFLLTGPSGVGKTETALALSEALYGGERNLISINLSEYQEAHTVSSLKGSPPGYVGYGEGGVLTEAVRRRPHSVILLDEAEKAHPDVMELFFQVFDKGVLEDGEGREIDFKNTVILLGSNVGTDKIQAQCADPALAPAAEALAESLRDDLLQVFPQALLGRMVVVPYFPLSPDVLERILALQLGRIAARLEDRHAARLAYDASVTEAVLERCTDTGAGARAIDRILTHHVLPHISAEILASLAQGRSVTEVALRVAAGEWEFDYAYA